MTPRETMRAYLESIGGLYFRDEPSTDPDDLQVDAGWYPLIRNLISNLIDLGWDRHVMQIKTKFGGLRFYAGDLTPEMEKRIQEAEDQSYEVCEACGDDACDDCHHRTYGGWIYTWCHECHVNAGRE